MPNQTVIIRFDGNYFSYTDNNGNLVRIPAISGATSSQNSQFQNVVNKGPIPEGLYNVSKYQNIADISSWDYFKSLFGKGSWKGTEDTWGTERVWLTPQAGTNTFGRAGFSIHGGVDAGSAGCIDLVSNAPKFFNFFKSLGSDAVLQVDYGSGYNGLNNPLTNGNSKITIENIYSNQGKDLNEIIPLQNFLSASKTALEEKLKMSISEKSVTELLKDYKIKSGNSLLRLQNNEMVNLDEETKAKIENSITTFKTKDGSEFSLVKDILIPLKDNTTSTLSSILNAIDSASNHLQSFLVGSVDFGKDLIDSVSSIFDSNNPQLFDRYNNPLYLDQFGNKTTETFHYLLDEDGNQIIDEEGNPIKVQNKKATGPSNLELLLADFASRVATGATIEEASIESAKTAIAREVSKDLVTKIGLDNTELQTGIAATIARIGTMHMNGNDPDAEDYGIAAMEGILIFCGVDPAIISGIIAATKKIAQENGKLNSDEYQDVAAIAISTAIVAAICIKIGAIVGTACGGPVGTVAGAVVGAVVGYLIAIPLYNAVRNGWENTEEIYDSLEDILKGEDIEENLKDLYKDLGDQLRIATVDLIRDIGRGTIKLLFGGYGKKLSAGEYWNPYSLLNIEAKADGTGKIIRGLEPQGVVAISSQDKSSTGIDDDIYGYFTSFCSLTKSSFANDNFLIKQQSKIKTAVRS
jgi:hypothetical protein